MNALELSLYALAGLAAGLGYFASLRWLTRRLLEREPHGAPPWARLALVQLLRLAALAALLIGAAQRGAWPLLALAAGVLAARAIVVARVRAAASGAGP